MWQQLRLQGRRQCSTSPNRQWHSSHRSTHPSTYAIWGPLPHPTYSSPRNPTDAATLEGHTLLQIRKYWPRWELDRQM